MSVPTPLLAPLDGHLKYTYLLSTFLEEKIDTLMENFHNQRYKKVLLSRKRSA